MLLLLLWLLLLWLGLVVVQQLAGAKYHLFHDDVVAHASALYYRYVRHWSVLCVCVCVCVCVFAMFSCWKCPACYVKESRELERSEIVVYRPVMRREERRETYNVRDQVDPSGASPSRGDLYCTGHCADKLSYLGFAF